MLRGFSIIYEDKVHVAAQGHSHAPNGFVDVFPQPSTVTLARKGNQKINTDWG